MIKILKYLKNSIFSILIIVFLLVLQAFFDLTLPDYTSKIVNVGVQQSGIENAAIMEIGESSLNELVLFMSEAEQGLDAVLPDDGIVQIGGNASIGYGYCQFRSILLADTEGGA